MNFVYHDNMNFNEFMLELFIIGYFLLDLKFVVREIGKAF